MLHCRLWTAGLLFLAVLQAAAADTSSVLKQVDNLLLKGRSSYDDAINVLTEALNKQGNVPKLLYKRAEITQLLKRHEDALKDLDAMLQANPNAKQAYQLRVKVLTKIGRFTEAASDWNVLASIYSKSSSKIEKTKKLTEAKSKAAEMASLGAEWEAIMEGLKANPKSEEANRRCIASLESMVKEARETDKFRLQRIMCAIAVKDHDTANHELSWILTVEPHNLKAMWLKASSMKAIGAIDAALANLRKCMSLDPEYELCKSLYKSIKKYAKHTDEMERQVERNDWSAVLQSVKTAFEMDSDPHNTDKLLHYRCKGHLEMRNLEEGVASCTAAIDTAGEKNPAAFDLYLFRADLHMMADELDQAENDLQSAGELQSHNQRLNEARHRLQKRKKMAARKDYYKILSVSRTASTSEIKKAYRKLAMQFHPDKLNQKDYTEEEKEKLTAQYKDIAESYHVLSDDEKRRKYDLGEDLEEQGGGGGFNQGFNPFGGGGGTFHFHFG